jgi:lysozyme
MTAAIPAARPRMSRADLVALVRRRHPEVLFDGRMVIVGVRGYYADTLGVPGVNDRGMYDDALFLIAPDAFMAFNANTDPSRVRKGSGTGAGKGMASLKPGAWPVYRFDLHSGKYLALCQRAGRVTVIRDGTPPYPETGMFGINIHKGGINTTSSEGCQTIPPAQWPAFIAAAQDQAKRLYGAAWRGEVLTYVLLEGVG